VDPSWSQCPESRNILARKLRIDLANTIMITFIFYRMVTSSIPKASTLTEKDMISSEGIMIMWLVTTFLVQSMQPVRFKRIKVTMLEIPEVTTKEKINASLDLITQLWCKMKPNSEGTTVVSMLHKRQDSTARASNTQTSSQIVEINQAILTFRMRRTSPEEILNIRTARPPIKQQARLWLSTHLPKTGSRGILR